VTLHARITADNRLAQWNINTITAGDIQTDRQTHRQTDTDNALNVNDCVMEHKQQTK
jgi:hypothetical protein